MSPVGQSITFVNLNLFLISVSKGISANLLKHTSKRRRTRTEIQADKDAAAQKEADTLAQLAELAAAREKLAEFEEMSQ